MVKKKPAYMPSRNRNASNKKAIIWIASVLIFIVVVMAVLLILDKMY